MVWVVVKKQEFVDLRVNGKIDGCRQGTVSPADMLLIFFVGVLGVEEENLRAVEKLDQFGSFAHRECACLFRRGPGGGFRVQLSIFVRFVIGHECNRAAAGVEPITYAIAGMIYETRMDPHA